MLAPFPGDAYPFLYPATVLSVKLSPSGIAAQERQERERLLQRQQGEEVEVEEEAAASVAAAAAEKQKLGSAKGANEDRNDEDDLGDEDGGQEEHDGERSGASQKSVSLSNGDDDNMNVSRDSFSSIATDVAESGGGSTCGSIDDGDLTARQSLTNSGGGGVGKGTKGPGKEKKGKGGGRGGRGGGGERNSNGTNPKSPRVPGRPPSLGNIHVLYFPGHHGRSYTATIKVGWKEREREKESNNKDVLIGRSNELCICGRRGKTQEFQRMRAITWKLNH